MPVTFVCAICEKPFSVKPAEASTARYCSRRCQGDAKKVPIEVRMDRYVDKSGGPDACWPFVGQLDKDGYGKISWNLKTVRPHRVAWILAHGEIPDGLQVLHKCDNRQCCNIAHLSLGTGADNMRDRDMKGRHWVPKGEDRESSRLNDDIIRKIRIDPRSNVAIAKDFDICHQMVSLIKKRRRWGHVI